MHWIVETEERCDLRAKGSATRSLVRLNAVLPTPWAWRANCSKTLSSPRWRRNTNRPCSPSATVRRGFAGREQLAVEAFADALEVIPRTLAQNAVGSLDTLLQTVAKQTLRSSDAHFIGLNVESKQPSNMVAGSVVEPLRITRQVLAGATEAALSVCIDDVLWAKQDPTVPELPDELSGKGWIKQPYK